MASKRPSRKEVTPKIKRKKPTRTLKDLRGNMKFWPNKDQALLVSTMAGCGLSYENIARVVLPGGISVTTLKKYFTEELETSKIRANTKVANTAYRMAVSGNVPAATFFWLKTQAGWRENRDTIEEPLPNQTINIYNLPLKDVRNIRDIVGRANPKTLKRTQE